MLSKLGNASMPYFPHKLQTVTVATSQKVGMRVYEDTPCKERPVLGG